MNFSYFSHRCRANSTVGPFTPKINETANSVADNNLFREFSKSSGSLLLECCLIRHRWNDCQSQSICAHNKKQNWKLLSSLSYMTRLQCNRCWGYRNLHLTWITGFLLYDSHVESTDHVLNDMYLWKRPTTSLAGYVLSLIIVLTHPSPKYSTHKHKLHI